MLWIVGLKLAKRLYNSKRGDKTPQNGIPSRRSGNGGARILAVFPLLIVMIAFILSIVCVQAGNKPGVMDDYAVFTLDTSRIGQNVRGNLTQRINDINLNFKRSLPLELHLDDSFADLQAPPTIAPRSPQENTSLREWVDKIQSDKIQSDAGDVAADLRDKGRRKAASAKKSAKGAANKAVVGMKRQLIRAINTSFRAIVSELELDGFYTVHVSSTCSGNYISSTGRNLTVGTTTLPDDGTTKKVESCGSDADIDPMALIRVIYWIGVVFTGIAFLLAIAAIASTAPHWAQWNMLASLSAFICMGLASAVTHGVALGAEKLVNFAGSAIGIVGSAGRNFIALTWATTCLLLLHLLLCGAMVLLRKRAAQHDSSSVDALPSYHPAPPRPDRTSSVYLPSIHTPHPTHSNPYTRPVPAMI